MPTQYNKYTQDNTHTIHTVNQQQLHTRQLKTSNKTHETNNRQKPSQSDTSMSTYRALIPTWPNDFAQWIWKTRSDTGHATQTFCSQPACTFQTLVGTESPLMTDKYDDCCWPGLHRGSTETCYCISRARGPVGRSKRCYASTERTDTTSVKYFLQMQPLVTLQQRQSDRHGTINDRDHPLTTRSTELSTKNNKPRMFKCPKNVFAKPAHISNLS